MLEKLFSTLLICLILAAICMSQESQSDTKILPMPVCLDGKSVYINRYGDVILETSFDYDSLLYFSDGLARFEENGKYGFIDEKGKVAIKPSFDSVQPFSEGLARFGENGKLGLIDKTGKIIVQPIYDGFNDFNNGFALVQVENGSDKDGYPKYKSGFIDKTGEIVIGKTKDKHIGKFDDASDFSEGLAPVKVSDKWGFVNDKDQTVIRFRFKEAKSFSEGLAPVSINGRKWGFIDKTGKFVIQPKFFSVNIFSEGLAAVSVNESDFDKTGFIDKSEKLVFKTPVCSIWIGEFSEGRATFFSKNGGGYIDKKGQIIFQEKDVLTTKFKDGIGTVLIKDFGTSYIDKTGNYIWNAKERNKGMSSKCNELPSSLK